MQSEFFGVMNVIFPIELSTFNEAPSLCSWNFTHYDTTYSAEPLGTGKNNILFLKLSWFERRVGHTFEFAVGQLSYIMLQSDRRCGVIIEIEF